jgi:beta-alanine degradation protein BauB
MEAYCFVGGEFLQKTNNNDPLVAASNVYKLLNENEKARVFKVTFKPGEIAKMHHHPDHLAYVLKGGKLQLTSQGKTDEIDVKEGSVIFLKEQDHEAKNVGNSTIDLIVVELK